MTRIIYIGGWGRSGSSVLANVLGSHADAVSVGELRYIWDRGVLDDKRCGCGENFNDCEFWSRSLESAGIRVTPEIAERMAERVGSRGNWAQIGALLTGRIKAYRRKRAKELERLFALYAAAADVAGAGTVVDSSKTPHYAVNLLLDPRFEVYFVHLIRDPRAVAYSWSRKLASKEASNHYLPRYSLLKCAVYWCAFNLFGLVFSWRRDVKYLRIRYEDFSKDAQETVNRILDHCELPHEGLTWHASNSVEIVPQHSISGNPSRFDTGVVTVRCDERWLTDLEPTKRRLITALCSFLLPLFRY